MAFKNLNEISSVMTCLLCAFEKVFEHKVYIFLINSLRKSGYIYRDMLIVVALVNGLQFSDISIEDFYHYDGGSAVLSCQDLKTPTC